MNVCVFIVNISLSNPESKNGLSHLVQDYLYEFLGLLFYKHTTILAPYRYLGVTCIFYYTKNKKKESALTLNVKIFALRKRVR